MKLRTALLIAFSLWIFSRSFAQQLTWERLNGPFAGYIWDIQKDKHNNLYTAVYTDIYKSTNKGEDWQRINVNQSLFPVQRIIPHSSGKIILFANGSILCSDVEMINWNQSQTGYFYLISDKNGNILSVRNNAEVLISKDTAKTFSSLNLSASDLHQVLPYNDSILFVTTKNGYHLTTNQGSEWNYYKANMQERVFTEIHRDGSGNLYMDDTYNVKVSKDMGASWGALKLPTGRFQSLFITDTDKFILAANDKTFMSTDFGTTWSDIPIAYGVISVVEITNEAIFMGSPGDLYKYNLVTKEVTINNDGISNARVYTVRTDNEYVYTLVNGAFYRSDDKGKTWETPKGVPQIFNGLFNENSSNKFLAAGGGNLIYSEDKGTTWKSIQITIPMQDLRYGTIGNVDEIYISTTKGQVLRTVDFGKNWKEIYKHNSERQIYVIHTGYDKEFLFAVDKTLYEYNAEKDLVRELQVFDGNIYSIEISKWGTIYVGTDENIYFGNKNTWKKTFIKKYGRAFIRKITKGNIIYLECGSGLWYSNDLGNSFKFIEGSSLSGHERTYSITDDNEIYVGTTASGISRSIFMVDNFSIPTNLELSQNYPNPFNSSTKIKVFIPNRENLTIQIFDILGQVVKTIVADVLITGYYKFIWQPQNLPSGVYFYRIQTPTFSETKKMIYLK